MNTLVARAPTRASADSSTLTEEQARDIAIDAYIYFYPIVTMDVTRKQSTNVPSGVKPGFGPMNTFQNTLAFPPPPLSQFPPEKTRVNPCHSWLFLTV